MTQFHPDIYLAYDKAVTTLRSRYTPMGIYAGRKHFSDLWARDFCFASFGALSLNDLGVVKAGLETLLKFIDTDGQIPLRVGQKNFLLKYFGIDARVPEARYIDDKGHSAAVDNNSLFLILAEKYVAKSGDLEFAREYYDLLKKALEWNFSQDSDYDHLIEEGYFAGWADSLKKEGKVLYTNVLSCHAVRSLAEICKLINHEDHDHFSRLYHDVKSKIYSTFWNGHYFIDWVTADHRQSTFSSDGNLLAIVFGIAGPDEAAAIQTYISENGMNSSFSTETRNPGYSKRHIYWPFFLINMADYHNGMHWLWIGATDIVAKIVANQRDLAVDLVTKMAHKIVEFGGVYEVYHHGAPVRRLFYRSEEWFAWSSGMFVWACHELDIHPHPSTSERGNI
ncbi:hypothetical protein EB093_01980 [bacterium]|nr:hypothetical protein [bacterium]